MRITEELAVIVAVERLLDLCELRLQFLFDFQGQQCLLRILDREPAVSELLIGRPG